MRLFVFIVSIWMILGCRFRKHEPAPFPELENFVDNSPCTYFNDFTAAQRLKRKPFGRARKIELVSFDGQTVGMLDSVFYSEPSHEIPKKNKEIDRNQLKDIIKLTPVQTDSLTNIFFNYDYGRAENGIISTSSLGCYNPRHAILFYRKETDSEPFAYFEVCLECEYVETFPRDYNLGHFCDGKYDLLRQFFRQTGVRSGLGN